jgi:hypothetical protein
VTVPERVPGDRCDEHDERGDEEGVEPFRHTQHIVAA